MEIQISKSDITKIDVDAIVNPANTSLLGGSGLDGKIHRLGGKEILEECQKIRNRQGGCKVSQAVITTAGKLPSNFVIHTVGPVWNGGNKNETQVLYETYLNCLELAEINKIKTIAFPSISTGIYKFPKEKAAEIAIKAINDFSIKSKQIQKVIFTCFEIQNYILYNKILNL